MLEPTKIPGRLLTCTDFRKGSEELHQELQKNQNKNFRLDDLSKDLQEYYKLQTIRHDTTPADVEILKSQHSGYNLFVRKFKKLKKSIKQGNILQVIREGINRRLKQNLKKEYKSVQTKPDLNKKFIYVPLPVQPERNTCPLGDIFVDQILMIETLSASLPSDWVIYVKEHPIQWLRRGLIFFDFRYQGYYKKIAQLKNVRVIPIETDTYTLIEKSQAVAIATGTIGWEATLKGKPALVFGYPWYKSCSEIFRVKDVESCKEAIKKIINGFAVNQQKIINYLKCFDNATIHGYINPELEKNPTLTKQENINNIIQRILLEMHE